MALFGRQEGTCSMAESSVVYVIVNNIPKAYRAADLRNFFSQFIETSGFSIFHFRHRPEIQQSPAEKSSQNNCIPGSSELTKSRCVTTCCVVRVYKERVNELLEMYNGKHWMDREGQTLSTKCFVKKINVLDDETPPPAVVVLTSKALKAGQKSLSFPAHREKFTKSDLASMIEMHPPVLMPQGNVGTPTKYFLEQIQACRLPPSIITRLALEFPKSRGKRLYGSVAFDYGGVKQKGCLDSRSADFVRTLKGDIISDTYLAPALQKKMGGEPDPSNAEEETEDEEEDSSAEEWDRHESLHNDVTQQERLKERLYEEPIELQWEKGGSGLVFYTDAQFWDAKEGDFDEKTADDWDIDTSGYYERGAGDKDARDLLQMRLEGRLRSGTTVDSDEEESSHFAAFEKHSKGFGRRLLEAHGWKQGEGIGKTVVGIAEPILNAGQHPRDKKGLGYRGEKLNRFSSGTRNRRKRRASSEDDRVFISTKYDDPSVTDPPEPLLRSSQLTKLKYRTEFLKEKS